MGYLQRYQLSLLNPFSLDRDAAPPDGGRPDERLFTWDDVPSEQQV